MKPFSPNAPLMTLIVESTGTTDPESLLAKFHPIVKEMGFGHFQKQESWLHSASRAGKSLFRAEDNVFAELKGNSLMINIEGESIFGTRSIERLLQQIKRGYESTLDCNVRIEGPDYSAALIGNLVFTAIPILLGSFIAIGIARFGFNEELPNNPTLLVYILAGAIATRTRFWINQRKKNRPVWFGALTLFLIPLGVLAIIMLVAGAMKLLA
jgi:hypothetical protein